MMRGIGRSVALKMLAGGVVLVSSAMTALAADVKTEEKVTLRVVTPEQYEQVIRQHRGKVVVVDFWATWCIPCVKAFPHTVQWHRELRDKGLVVMSMSMDDPEQKEDALKFLTKQKATFTNLLSSLGGEEKGMEAFKVEGGAVPHFKIYGRDGKLVRQFGADPDNPWDHSDVEKAIREVLAAKR